MKEIEFQYGEPVPTDSALTFLPGLVSTDTFEFNACFSPDGREFYFSRHENHDIFMTTWVDGSWSNPAVTSFSDAQFKDCDPMISRDGKKLYFISTRPRNSSDTIPDFDIWFVERNGSTWGEPVNLEAVNSDSSEFYISIADNGNLYFASSRPGGYGSYDIYYSKFLQDHYTSPENAGPSINDEHFEHDPLIAPDESFIIFTSVDRKDGFGAGDLYRSLRRDTTWTAAENLGPTVNTASYELTPYISPDEKFFFFTSQGDVKWMPLTVVQP